MLTMGRGVYCAVRNASGTSAIVRAKKRRDDFVFPPAVLTASGSKGLTAAAILSARGPRAPPTFWCEDKVAGNEGRANEIRLGVEGVIGVVWGVSSTPLPENLPLDIPAEGKVYRLATGNLVLGVVGLVLFTGASVCTYNTAMHNSDGSFRNPELFAYVFGGGWLIPAFGSVWLLITYFRRRLWIGPEGVRLRGWFGTREIQFSAITRVEWKTYPGTKLPAMREKRRWHLAVSAREKLVLHDQNGELKISFRDYLPKSLEQRYAMIQFFRQVTAGQSTEGWERFATLHNCLLGQDARKI